MLLLNKARYRATEPGAFLTVLTASISLTPFLEGLPMQLEAYALFSCPDLTLETAALVGDVFMMIRTGYHNGSF